MNSTLHSADRYLRIVTWAATRYSRIRYSRIERAARARYFY